jgi:phage terminase small subunit
MDDIPALEAELARLEGALKKVEAEKPLNLRYKRFVEEYALDLNGKRAAIRAGYSPNGAEVTASQLLSLPNVAAALERTLEQRRARVNISADAVMSEIAALANSRLEHYVLDDYGNLTLALGAPDNAMAAVKSLKKKIRHDKDGSVTYDVSFELWDKPGQLKLMGRHAGAKACFDRVEHTGADGGPIQITEVRSVIVDPQNDNAR